MAATVARFDTGFTAQMHALLDALTHFAASEHEQHMASMVARLDYNGYYSGLRRATPTAT